MQLATLAARAAHRPLLLPVNGTGALAGLMTGWLCDVGGTELAFAVSGIIGLVAVGATALGLGWSPRLVARRRANQPQHA